MMAASLATADICDERGDEVVVLQGPFIDFGGKKTFSGRLVIVRSFEDNVLAGKELEKDGRGKVLLIDGGGSLRCALFGDMMASKAIKNNWEGVIVNGAIRDSKQIGEMGLGVKALGTNPKKSFKKGTGEVNVTCELFGKTIVPNQQVFCDEDGILLEVLATLSSPPRAKL